MGELMQHYLHQDRAPITASLYSILESNRADIRQLRSDVREQRPDADAVEVRIIELEAEATALWHVFDGVLDAIHRLETGEAIPYRIAE